MGIVVQTAYETPLPERYQALLRVSQTLMSNRCSEGLLSLLARELREVVNFDFLGVGIYDEKAHEVCTKTFGESDAPVPAPKLAPEETLTWWVYRHQQPLVVSSLEAETRFPAVAELLNNRGIRSVCALPLTTVNRRLGALNVGSVEADAYGGEEVSFLSLVANQVALAVDDALNFEASESAQVELRRKQAELRRERDQLQLLLEVTNSMVSNLELRDLLRAISASIRQGMHCDAVGVFLPDSERCQLRLLALDFPESKGFGKEDSPYPVEGSVPGRVFKTGKPFVGTKADLMSEQDAPETRAEGIESVCALPLISRNRTLGVLGLGSRAENSFSPEDVDFLLRAAGQVAIAIENALAYREITDLKDKLAQEKLYLEEEIRSEVDVEGIVGIIGQSSALRQVLQLVETVAPSDSTVLLLGETGTGKELIARAIHDRSRRKDRTLVKLNCAAIPTGLLESELFGHERGAFTGAVTQKIGRLELADQGTLFLDEVGDIPLELQPKLLRALQEREFERLGSTRTQKVDIRLVAATNRDLQRMVEEKQFRSDLYYRLNVIPIRIPPLRERPEDIPLLVRYFTEKYARRMQKKIETIPAASMGKLARWHWPGNIRELENLVERAVVLSPSDRLAISVPELTDGGISAAPAKTDKFDEQDKILRILKETKGRVGGADGAAARMGLKRTTLITRMKRLGIDPRRFP
jgi:formate hydrogenlyase transcriptional activator